MVLKLSTVWGAATEGTRPFVPPLVPLLSDIDDTDFDSEDLDIPKFLRERKKAKEHEREAAATFERNRTERQAVTQRKEQAEEDEWQRETWLNSEHYRAAMKELAADLQDARETAQRAYLRAQAGEEKAHAALESARRNALVLADDRRVYFTRNRQHLYGEDDREITDGAMMAEAQRQQRSRPDATTYEDYAEKKGAERQANDHAKTLRKNLDHIDELEKRIKQGELRPEELAQANREKQTIIDDLPADARAEYDRLHAVRQDAISLSYRAADPAFTAAPDLSTDFQRARAATLQAQAYNPKTTLSPSTAMPAYR